MDPKPLLVLLLCLSVNAQWDCTTYLGNKGRCVILNECQTLKQQLTRPKPDKNFFEILKRYNCGYENMDPKVCCPEPVVTLTSTNGKDCITPNGDVGTCTKLEDCGYMNDKLLDKVFVTQDNVEFIKRSKCNPSGSATSLYVCCKSETDNRSPAVGTSYEIPSTPGGGARNQCMLNAFPPAPDSSCCGVDSSSDSRIIGGKEAGIDQFPWLALIEYTRIGYSCGGSLISGKYVLSAAHCLVGSKGKSRKAVSVRLGEYNNTNPGIDCVKASGGGDDCTEGDISVPIESYTVHEGYDAEQVLQYNDIALIRLNKTVQFTDFIRPICLPSTDITMTSPDDLDLFIAGWGIFDENQQHSSEVKLFANVPFVRKEQCNDRYLKLGRQSLADTQLCAGGEENKDSCKGDSGGPLMLLKNLTYEAAGVISFGTKSCGLKNWPSIYTKVYDYLDWIRDNIKP